MEAELLVAFYFQKFENHTLKFEKKCEKILNVGNDEIYKRAKSQCKILCVIDYTKMTKSNRFYSFQMCTIHYYQIHTFVISV
jgi:hypothetical protein